jgi:hypothetical protein
MKMLYRWPIIALVLLFAFSGDVGASAGAPSTWKEKLTKETIIINEKDGSLSFLAEVNGKYFYQPTRHCAVFAGGKFGEKPIFQAFADPVSFYHALVKLGFKPGNNMTLKNKETTNVQGDLLDITITWDGAKKAYTLDEVIKDKAGKPIVMRFGGNLENSTKAKTGCLLCLDSCPVGIGSNASYTYGAVEKRSETGFMGNKDVLPPDGTLVVITVKHKK